MKKSIINSNDNGEAHGYQEYYMYEDFIQYRGNYKHNNEIGYIELHGIETAYYIR